MSKGENIADSTLPYKLYGMVVHDRQSVQEGHYYTFVKNSDSAWYEMNDNQVHLVDFTTVQERKAYMLFYIQQPASANSPPVCNASSPYSRPDLSTLPGSEATSPMAGDKTEETQIAAIAISMRTASERTKSGDPKLF